LDNVVQMRRTFRFRLYPTRRQARALEHQLGQACDLYNAALQHRRDGYRKHGRRISYHDQSVELRQLRSEGLIDAGTNYWSQQAVLRRLDRAFAAFFRRCKAGEKPGYPRFRSRRRYDTLEWSFAGNAGGIALTAAGRLRMQGVGYVKIKMHRPLPVGAKLCEARVTRRAGKWYVSLLLAEVAPRPLPATGRSVGLDVGISTFAATSDPHPDWSRIEGPRANRAAAASVRRAQRKVARRRRGSNRRRKAVALLARHREHERNVRRDHAHRTARKLVERYDLIAVENLNVRGLARGMLARDVNDQGWGALVALLGEKAEDAARRLVLIDPRNTSQACSACGAIVRKPLAERVHSCACGYRADRDVNAARNVLWRALGPDGAVGRERWADEGRAVVREAA
jgi:putative transposase